MLYVYAIIDGGNVALSGNGLEGRTLESLSHDGLAVVFSRHGSRVEPSPENLWLHERAVESLMRDHAVLPSRFGTMLADEETLRKAVARHAAELSAGLERVRGCIELGLRVLWPQEQTRSSISSVASDHASGRAYMLARLEEERRRKGLEREALSLFDRIHDELDRLARDGIRRASSTSQWMLTAAYLVERDAVDRFRQRLREVRGLHPDLRVLCTGPWPPYNFVPSLGHDRVEAEVRHA
jgi:hypothetical protein